MTSWHQKAADIERQARKVQLDMEEMQREQLVVKKRITNQPMDVKQALRVRDNLCVPSSSPQAHHASTTMHPQPCTHQNIGPAQVSGACLWVVMKVMAQW